MSNDNEPAPEATPEQLRFVITVDPVSMDIGFEYPPIDVTAILGVLERVKLQLFASHGKKRQMQSGIVVPSDAAAIGAHLKAREGS